MRKKSLKKWFGSLLCVSLFVSGCATDKKTDVSNMPEQENKEVNEKQTGDDTWAKSTVMIYMVGSNLESEGGLASLDISEIVNSGYNEENMEVLVCAGGTSHWWIDGFENNACDVYRVSGDGLQRVYRMENKNMGDQETLEEFVNYVYANSDAQYYDLVMWNHGGGAVLGFGADENYDYDALSMTEIDQALKQTRFIADGNKLEWVGFDACLMGMIEVADVMSNYAKYLIASEEVEAGTGWDYSCLRTLSDGQHSNGEEAAREIIDAFGKSNENETGYHYDYTLSCLDLTQVGEAISSFEALIMEAEQEIRNGGYSRIARGRDQTKTFGRVSSTSFYDTIDLYDFAMRMMKLYPAEAEALQSSLNNLVVYEKSNVMGAHGVAVYFPYENKDYAEAWMREYRNIGFSEEYVRFLQDFTATLSGEQLAEWDICESVPRESEEIAGEYYVQLTEEQAANYARAKFSVWEKDWEDSYICWLSSSDVTLSEDGKLSSNFSGKRFFLTDDTGKLIPCTAIEIERNEEYTKLVIMIMVARGALGDDDFMFEPVNIHIRVDDEHPDGEIVGIYHNRDEEDETLFPEKTSFVFEEGDVIYQFLFARKIVFREDGSVAPFEEWESSSGTGEGFVLSGELQIVSMEPEETNEYCCLFDVKDTQGNSYYTNPVYIEY